jgi:hypothetical protein
VRDEEEFEVAPHASGEELGVQLTLLDASGAPVTSAARAPGTIRVAGRTRTFAAANEPPAVEATFGDSMQLVRHRLDPQPAKPGGSLTVQLRWHSVARIQRGYKIFVHVLDARGEQVLAQRDAEPQDGRAPTSSWQPGELLDDEFVVALPASMPPGDYPVEVGVYDERSGTRLLLADGDSRVILKTRLQVR